MSLIKYKPTQVYDNVVNNLRRVNLLRGSARSSKTNSMLAIAVRWLWTGYIGEKHIPTGDALILRETMPSLKRTVMREFLDMLHMQGMLKFIDWRKTQNEFFYKGRRIAFMSMDDETKILGMQTVWFWENEANNAPFNIFSQLLMRCEQMCFLDYNPFDMFGWINQELEIKRMNMIKDVALTVSTYRDNPYLPQGIIDEISNLKHLDDDLYKVYNLGEWVVMRGLVYSGYTIVDHMLVTGKRVLGLDFGFTHAAAIVEVVMAGNDIYLNEIFYEKEMLTSDLILFLKASGNDRVQIIADNSRPEAIAEMKRHALRVKRSKKGADSVRHGINNVKLYKMHVTKNSHNLIRELQQYKWATDKDDIPKEEPVKMFDDCLDAVRYAVSHLHRDGGRLKIIG